MGEISLQLMGDRPRAKLYFSTALENDPQHTQAKASLQSLEEPPMEKLQYWLDDRLWTRVPKASESVESQRFLLKGDDLDHFKEMVSVEFFKGDCDRKTLEVMVEATKKNLRDWAGSSLTWKILSISEFDVVYEWTIQGHHNIPAQFELSRMMLGRRGIHGIRYITKTIPVEEAIYKRWLGIIKAAKVVNQ